MKISHNKVGQNVNISDSGKSDRTQKSKMDSKVGESTFGKKPVDFFTPDSGVSLDLSDRAQEAKKIKELATAAPDVDDVKVAKFRQLIADGQYKVDPQAVADKMLQAYSEDEA